MDGWSRRREDEGAEQIVDRNITSTWFVGFFCASRHVPFGAPCQMSADAKTVRVRSFVSHFFVSV